MTPTETKIYNTAKACLGKHITLNSNVPNEVGCAESVSYVLTNSDITGIPAGGFASTSALFDWLSSNPSFERLEAPEQGAILVSPTGHGNGTIEGHTGIVAAYGAYYPYEYGILSNNSDNGLFQEKWSLLSWWQYYGLKGALPLAFFRAK